MSKYKQVIVVRSDLDMSPGKLAVQVAHAALNAAEKTRTKKPKWFEGWKKEKQKKVVVEVSSEERLRKLKEEAEKLGIPKDLVRDAGLTELTRGTATALGVGPGPENEVDKVTGNLKLLTGGDSS